MSTVVFLAAANASFLSSNAFAEDEFQKGDTAPMNLERNLYMGAFGGWDFPAVSGTYLGPRDNQDSEVQRSTRKEDWTAGLIVGTEIAPFLRGELELSYVRLDGDQYTSEVGEDPKDLIGDIQTTYLLGNLWRDFQLSDRLTPYIGAGLGIALLDVDLDYSFETGARNRRLDSRTIAMAAQIGAGVRYRVGENWHLDAGYRAKAVLDTELRGPGGGIPEFPNAVSQYLDHIFQIGLSYDFAGATARDEWRSSPAFDVDGWYVGIFGAYVKPNQSAFVTDGHALQVNYEDDAFSISGVAGLELVDGLRGELELHHYRNNAVNHIKDVGGLVQFADGHVNTTMATVNIWKDINTGTNFTPYIGAGIGLGRIDSNLVYETEIDGYGVGVAMQVGAGLRVGVSENVALDFGYRMRGVLEAPFTGTTAGMYHSNGGWSAHSIQAGVVFGPGSNAKFLEKNSPLENVYVSAFGGGVIAPSVPLILGGDVIDMAFKSGYSVSGAVGAELPKNFRAELEFNYSHYEPTILTLSDGTAVSITGHTSFAMVMGNLWKDIDLGSIVTPYVGAGIGAGYADLEMIAAPGQGLSDGIIAFGAQVGAGLRLDVSERFSVDAGYRFRAYMMDSLVGGLPATGVEYGRTTYYNHAFHTGVSYKM